MLHASHVVSSNLFALELQGHHGLSLCWHYGRLPSSPIPQSLFYLHVCLGLKQKSAKPGKRVRSGVTLHFYSSCLHHRGCHRALQLPHTHPHAQTNGRLLRYMTVPGALGEIYSSASNSQTRQHEDIGFKLPTLQWLEDLFYSLSHSNPCIHMGLVDLIGWKIDNYLRFADIPITDKRLNNF